MSECKYTAWGQLVCDEHFVQKRSTKRPTCTQLNKNTCRTNDDCYLIVGKCVPQCRNIPQDRCERYAECKKEVDKCVVR